MSALRIKVAQKAIKNYNMLNINATLESDDNIYYDDVIYVEFKGGNKNQNKATYGGEGNEIKFKFTSLELRSLSYGLKQLVKSKQSDFIKYSNPKLAGSQGNLKQVSLGFSQGQDGASNYFINAAEGNKKIEIKFSAHSICSFSDMIMEIAIEVDKKLYEIQRHIDMIQRKKKGQ